MTIAKSSVSCVVDCKNLLGEGVVWDHLNNKLWWLDVPMPSRLMRYDPMTEEVDEWNMPEMITALALRKTGDSLLVASHGGINFFDPENGSFRRVLTPEPNQPFNRCNDGAVDQAGNFWFGTMQNNIAPNADTIELASAAGSIYRLSPHLELRRFERGIAVTNTACWSPDNRRFYTCDSLKSEIYQYDFDTDKCEISGKRLFSACDNGVPDGSAMDEEGHLWNARWGGGCIVRISPQGDVVETIPVPCENVTSCAFAGNNFDTLYITTARYLLPKESLDKNPQSGGVFKVELGVRGMPANPFGG